MFELTRRNRKRGEGRSEIFFVFIIQKAWDYCRWEKAVGDSVSVDEIICEIETDKTSVPVSTPPLFLYLYTYISIILK